MVKIRAVQIRLTRTQHERIKHNAQLKGFASLAAYLRYVALQHDLELERKVSEIHRHFLGGKEPNRKSKQKTITEFENL